MESDKFKDKFEEDLLIQAEIFTTWGPFLGSNEEVHTLTQSIIFKLEQAHFHLEQAQHNSQIAIEALMESNNNKRIHYNFVTNCNVDAMIHALNSLMDVIAKFIILLYFDKKIKKWKFKSFMEYEGDSLKKSKTLISLEKIDPVTADIILSFFNLEEREYVNEYCNDNKHEKAFFAASSYFYFDVNKEEEIKGYNLKNRFKNDGSDKELREYAPKLFKVHLEKICELGRTILKYKDLIPYEFNEDLLKYLEMTSIEYYKLSY